LIVLELKVLYDKVKKKFVNRKKMASTEMCVYCFDSLIFHFEQKKLEAPFFENVKYPLFVTWHKDSSKHKEPVLRGCIGTFKAKSIHQGLSEFALTSALKDGRFSPVNYNEIPLLSCSVSLLLNFEKGKDVWDWEIGTHGIIIDFTDPKGVNRGATYLPEVASEQGWDQEETLKSLIKKSGYDGQVSDSLLQNIILTRYQSSKSNLHYKEYISLKGRNL